MKYNKKLEEIKVYEAGKPIDLVVRDYGLEYDQVVKLASNENPLGTSPKAAEVLVKFAHEAFRYPDDSYYELKNALASKYSVDAKNLILGAGSDQIIEFACHAFLDNGECSLSAGVTFAMYEIYTKLAGAKLIKTKSALHSVQDFKQSYDEHKPKVVFLCVPNNPLGECFTRDEVYELISYFDKETAVVVDCAYMEYAAKKSDIFKIEPKELIEKFPNAIYMGTFSKAYGLGGMRVGYGIASEEITQALHKLRPPFNVTTLSAKAALAALNDNEFLDESLKLHFEELPRYEAFANKAALEYIDSFTNFITYKFPETLDSKKVAQTLLEQGVIIRNLSSYGINGIRITIGTKTQNDRFFEVFAKALGI
jgi:histidinol-phosphate aminotransferase